MEKQSLMAHNNLVRAGVMGGNDGILSVAGIIVGVAGAGQSLSAIMLSGFAGTLAGMVSMAMGEFVSVRSAHDAQEKARQSQEQALKKDYEVSSGWYFRGISHSGYPRNDGEGSA